MIINNKIESYNKIIELNLNKFPEQLFHSNEEEKVKQFKKDYPAKYYAIRDKSKPGGVFKLKVPRNKLLNEIKNYSVYTINVSSINYIDNQLLVGEIEILSNDEVFLTVSTNPTYSVRDAVSFPDYNLKTNIYDKTLNKIPCFDDIYSYIIKHHLKDIIVEFAFFNIEIGIKKEKIIIYELRTNY